MYRLDLAQVHTASAQYSIAAGLPTPRGNTADHAPTTAHKTTLNLFVGKYSCAKAHPSATATPKPWPGTHQLPNPPGAAPSTAPSLVITQPGPATPLATHGTRRGA